MSPLKKLLTALVAVAVLTACSAGDEPAAAPPTSAAPTPAAATTARPTTVPVSTDLPPAPPVEQWVEKGSDFQQTLDVRMTTELIKLGVDPGDATVKAGRDLAYLVCATLRAGVSGSQVNELVQTAYPSADGFDAVRIIVTAQAYCLDTV